MSGHKYITNSSSLFEDEEEISDETFLKNFSNKQPTAAEIQLSYEQRKQTIEQRTLESSHRSLGLLHETEQVGIATAGNIFLKLYNSELSILLANLLFLTSIK